MLAEEQVTLCLMFVCVQLIRCQSYVVCNTLEHFPRHLLFFQGVLGQRVKILFVCESLNLCIWDVLDKIEASDWPVLNIWWTHKEFDARMGVFWTRIRPFLGVSGYDMIWHKVPKLHSSQVLPCYLKKVSLCFGPSSKKEHLDSAQDLSNAEYGAGWSRTCCRWSGRAWWSL